MIAKTFQIPVVHKTTLESSASASSTTSTHNHNKKTIMSRDYRNIMIGSASSGNNNNGKTDGSRLSFRLSANKRQRSLGKKCLHIPFPADEENEDKDVSLPGGDDNSALMAAADEASMASSSFVSPTEPQPSRAHNNNKPPTTSSSLLLWKRRIEEESLLKTRLAIHNQSQREHELKASLGVHWARAQARHASRNTLGAVLSLKRVKRLEMECANVTKSLGYLLKLEQTLLRQQQNKTTTMTGISNNIQQDNEGGAVRDYSSSGGDSLAALLQSGVVQQHSSSSSHRVTGVLDIDFELDRIINTQVDYYDSEHATSRQSDEELLAEMLSLTAAVTT